MGETTSRIEIVPAVPEDAETIYGMSLACLPGETWQTETVISDMARDGTAWFVAKREGKPVGFASFWFVLDEAELVNTAVREDARRLGLASQLLEMGLAEAQQRGMKTMFLEVRVGNLAAQKLYEKYGFHVIGTRKGEYDNPREDGYIMERTL